MNNKYKISTIIFLILLFAPFAYGAEIYVDVNASGSGTGTDWTNAYTSLQKAENAAGRGDTIYVAEGKYNEAVIFNVPESGSTVITVSKCGTGDGTCTSADGYKAEDHDGQAIFTQSSGSVWAVSTGYWTFDGVTGGGPGSWDSGHGFKLNNTGKSGPLRGFACNTDIDNVELKRIEIQMGGNTGSGGAYGIISSDYTGDLTGWLIQRCYLHDSNGANLLTKGHDGLIVEYNLFARNYSDAAFHGEAWTAEYDDNVIVRYNIFEDNYGSGIIFFKINGTCSPAMDGWAIYGNLFWWTPEFRAIPQLAGTVTSGNSTTMIDTSASFPVDGSLVGMSINNSSDAQKNASCTITSNTATSITCSEGLADGSSWSAGNVYKISHEAAYGVLGRGRESDCGGDEGHVTNLKFYNNTIAYINQGCWDGESKICSASSATINFSEGSGNIAKNNIVIGSEGQSTDWGNVTASYNTYYDVIKATGVDKTSILASEIEGEKGTGNPFSNSDLRTGFNLLSATNPGDSSIGAAYSTDAFGNKRGADGNWDRGKYEYNEADRGGIPSEEPGIPPNVEIRE